MANRMLQIDEREWAKQQTNIPLLHSAAAETARVLTTRHRLTPHPDRWKVWDSYLASYHTKRTTKLDMPVLDAGACRDPKFPSAYLPNLKKLGFKNLHGCNLDEKEPVVEDGATYQFGDITASPYPDNHFGFVACLSTIEHGVDWRKFYVEMARILTPGGHLFVSFDYWMEPIDTGSRMAFGAPVKIFNATDVMHMAIFAHELGLRLVKQPDLQCKEKVVNWIGLDYTFMNLLFRRVNPSLGDE